MKQAKKQTQAQQQVAAQVLQDEDTQATAEEYDSEPAFNEIDKLEQHGINAADIGKLKAGGICTVLAVLMW